MSGPGSCPGTAASSVILVKGGRHYVAWINPGRVGGPAPRGGSVCRQGNPERRVLVRQPPGARRGGSPQTGGRLARGGRQGRRRQSGQGQSHLGGRPASARQGVGDARAGRQRRGEIARRRTRL